MDELQEFEPLDPQPTHQPAAGPVLEDYDRFVVAFSGGKDSLALLLHLLDRWERGQ